MASLSYSDLIARFPELSGDADHQTRVGTHLELADLQVSVDGIQPGALDLARLCYAAHYTALSSSCGAGGRGAGPVTGRTRGSRSVSYASPSNTNTDRGSFMATRYGQLYLDLLRAQGWVGGIVI
ncbi:MAG: DUF4054 domain-containing protein [bacterium]|nr:DUF4054 domain-containing protein [bacterium]